MNIAPNLYRPRPRERTRGERWYDEQVEAGKRQAELLKQKMGWGRCAKFPVEAREVE